jgi:hypothetical protein
MNCIDRAQRRVPGPRRRRLGEFAEGQPSDLRCSHRSHPLDQQTLKSYQWFWLPFHHRAERRLLARPPWFLLDTRQDYCVPA